MKRTHYFILLTAGLIIACGLVLPNTVSAYNTIRVASGLDQPCFAVSPLGDKDRFFIVEQKTAKIKVLSHGILQVTPFLDLGSIVGGNHEEQGLLGLAFHPNFLSNGFFYVSYTTADNTLHVVRYHANPNLMATNFNNPDNPLSILTLPRTVQNHYGGALAFGPDGYLYIAAGDGDLPNDPNNYAQDGQTLLGKILRLDVNSTPPYTIPSTNPFLNDEDIRGEVWALGLHNPSGISFDPITGNLFITDVGQDNFEEINVQPTAVGGQNYGWTVFEGSYSTGRGELSRGAPVVTFPTYEYPHNNNPSWVIGGSIYRGTALPELQGSYFFADKYSGQIFSLKYGASEQAVLNRTADFLPTDNNVIHQPACIVPDGKGDMFLVDRKGGEVYKMVPDVPNMVTQLKVVSTTTQPPPNPQIDQRLSNAPPPIVIPIQGGSIAFNAVITNINPTETPNPASFDFWTDLMMPDHSVLSPQLQFLNNKLYSGESIGWGSQLQLIPAYFPEGEYVLQGHTGHYPDEPWYNLEIHFSKAASNEHTDSPGAAPLLGWNSDGISAGLSETFPTHIELMDAYPNPFNPETVLRFTLPQAASVQLTVVDISGRQVATLVNGLQEAGVHQVAFNGTNMPSGIYLYRFQTDGFTAVNKMTLIK
jgi:glucose/arabinose dehydrogenase